MTITEGQEQLNNELGRLSPQLRIAFAANCAEQALPKYDDWSIHEGADWGNPKRLRDALTLIWQFIEYGNIEPAQIDLEYRVIHALVPDSEIFPRASGNGAMDAGLALLEAIDCARTGGSIENAVSASYNGCLAAEVVPDPSKFHKMTQAELAVAAGNDSEQALKEWHRQLEVVKKLSSWHSKAITREQFANLLSQ